MTVATALAADALGTLEAEQQALYDRVAPSVVYLVTQKSVGSGFFVDGAGLVLTAAHVVEGEDTVEVIRLDGARQTARVVGRGAGTDLALVDTDWTGTPALPLAGTAELRVGSWVASVGHAEGGGWTYTTGMVTNVYAATGERAVFQTQIPLNPGNSGGPVLDRKGNAVGIVNAGLMAAQAINFATRSDVALRAFSQLEGDCRCLVIHAPAAAPVFVDGRMVGTGPRVAVTVTEGAHTVFVVASGKRVERNIRWPDVRSLDLSP